MSVTCFVCFLILGASIAVAQPGYHQDFDPRYESYEYHHPSGMEGLEPRSGYKQMMQQSLVGSMRGLKRQSPVAPTQWQMMVSPLLSVLPDASEYCHCKGMANCGCCLGFYVKPLIISNNICLNVSMTSDEYTQSQYMMRIKIHYDQHNLIEISGSEQLAPKLCITLPLFPFSVCFQITNVHHEKQTGKLCTCFGIFGEYREQTIAELPIGCICAGKPIANQDKRGLSQLMSLNILSSFSDMLSMFG